MAGVTVATLKLLGDHVALDFTNTVNSRGADFGPDVLKSYEDLLEWGMRLGVLAGNEAAALCVTPARQANAALHRAKILREAIYRIFAAEPSADPADLEILQREVCAAYTVRVLVQDAGGYGWAWQTGDPDTVTRRIAIAAADLLVSPFRARVHVCPGENCAWLFRDTSRSGHRVWCSEATCGGRSRIRRWRQRSKS